MKKLLILFSLLLCFSCSKEDYQIENDSDKGELLITQASRTNVQSSSTKSIKASSQVEIPETMYFENWYSGHDMLNDIEASVPNSSNPTTVKVPLEFGSYNLYANGTSKFAYEFISADDSGNSQEIKRNIDVKFYGKANVIDSNSDGSFDITPDNRTVKGSMKMEIINGPLLIRFYQLCNHPEDGSNHSNPYWEYTNNKSIEYTVDIKYKKRRKGNDFVSIESDDYPTNAYESESRRVYKLYVFFHYVYVFDLGDQLLDGSVVNNGSGLFAYAKSTDLNNFGFYDFDLPNTEKAEVEISYRKYVLKEYPLEEHRYGHDVRNYLDRILKEVIDYKQLTKGNTLSDFAEKYKHKIKIAKHGYKYYSVDNHYSYLTQGQYYIILNGNKKDDYCNAYHSDFTDVYDLNGKHLLHYHSSVNNWFHKSYNNSSWWDGYWKPSESDNWEGDLETIFSEVAKLKKYRIGVKEYDGSGTLGTTKSTSTNQNDIGIIDINQIQL